MQRSAVSSQATGADFAAVALRPAWVEIDLAAVRGNVAEAKRLAGRAKLFVVVKGDGYGGGVIEIAKAAVEAGTDAIAVGAPADALALRSAGIACPILMYASTLPEHAALVASLGIAVTIHDFASLDAFARCGVAVEAWVKVDCGLGRLGFNPDEFVAAFARLQQAKTLRLGGIYAHFALPEEPAVMATQQRIFAEACRAAEHAGQANFERMVASSRVMLGYPDLNFTAINPGRFILGLMEPPWASNAAVRPAVHALKSRIIQIKDLPEGTVSFGGAERKRGPVRAAVLPIGYGEGLPHAPPCHEVLVRGKRAKVLSRRGIEHTVIDVTGIPGVAIGEEAVLLGSQGGDAITAEELAAALKVPVLELIPRIARCAPRRYVERGEVS
jgi:alanine racemase